jgi:hypothetical protein
MRSATVPSAAALSVVEHVVAAAIAGWVVVTATSQHPSRTFDRLRPYDRTGAAIPNWRFFAPEPAVHDYRVLHRVLDADGQQSPWTETNVIEERHWSQAFWYPNRRQQKAVSDVCSEMASLLNQMGDSIVHSVGYRLLRDHVNRLVTSAPGRPPQGFQFLIVSDAGYDESEEPRYVYASRFERCANDDH